jgi:hypothetical protein
MIQLLYHPISRFTIESNKVNSENCWPSCRHTGRNANLYWAVFPSVVAATTRRIEMDP